MTDSSDTIALAALLLVARDVAPDLPQGLIEAAYAIQKKHQFDRDREVSLQAMQRLVEEYLNRTISESVGDGV